MPRSFLRWDLPPIFSYPSVISPMCLCIDG
jgi:hypothetical protein